LDVSNAQIAAVLSSQSSTSADQYSASAVRLRESGQAMDTVVMASNGLNLLGSLGDYSMKFKFIP
jgi:hypothetical protein